MTGHDHSAEPASRGKPRAQTAILSPAKRDALIACLGASVLEKRQGAWHGRPDDKRISGITVADLARDGMLIVATNQRSGSARLTERGHWFARTLLHDAAAATSESADARLPRLT
jgi:hypothetical protein